MFLSEHISEAEYRCPCCQKLPPDVYNGDDMLYCYDALFNAFESLGTSWGKAITIGSGYRCAKHNAEVGGEGISVHLFGLALDLQFGSQDEVNKFVKLVEQEEPDLRLGYKLYAGQNFLHIDVGFLIHPRPTDSFQRGVRW